MPHRNNHCSHGLLMIVGSQPTLRNVLITLSGAVALLLSRLSRVLEATATAAARLVRQSRVPGKIVIPGS